MTEDRLIDLETKFANQEHLLVELNDALASQQTQISDLQKLCKILVNKMRSLSDAAPPNNYDDEPPPHY